MLACPRVAADHTGIRRVGAVVEGDGHVIARPPADRDVEGLLDIEPWQVAWADHAAANHMEQRRAPGIIRRAVLVQEPGLPAHLGGTVQENERVLEPGNDRPQHVIARMPPPAAVKQAHQQPGQCQPAHRQPRAVLALPFRHAIERTPAAPRPSVAPVGGPRPRQGPSRTGQPVPWSCHYGRPVPGR